MRGFLIPMAMMALLVTSCGWRPGYEKDYAAEIPQAQKACSDYGQVYVQLYYNGGWKVICKQESPTKYFVKELN